VRIRAKVRLRSPEDAGQRAPAGHREGIARQRPGPEANALRKLLAELDGAVYGDLRLDVARWKRSFRRRLVRAFSNRRSESQAFSERGLPKLNP
jgi:hypothetical protein